MFVAESSNSDVRVWFMLARAGAHSTEKPPPESSSPVAFDTVSKIFSWSAVAKGCPQGGCRLLVSMSSAVRKGA